MKPVLVIGLGNTLMGDDGIGVRIAELIEANPLLPDDTEVIAGGTDLLRYAARIEGRRRVLVIDAVEDSGPPGSVQILDVTRPETPQHAHHLSVEAAVALLRAATGVEITLAGVSIVSAQFFGSLSPELAARTREIVDWIIRELTFETGASIPEQAPD
jgi:hydrogenase maturation protease